MKNSSSFLLISVVVAVLAGSTTWSSAAEAQVMAEGRFHQASYAALQSVADVSAGTAASEIRGGANPQLDGVIPSEQLLVQDYTVGKPFVLGDQTVEFIKTVTNNLIDTTLEIFDYFFDN